EGRDLVDLCHRELHFLREGSKARGGKMPVTVVDLVQALDQQIALARPVPEESANLVERLRIDLPALGGTACLALHLSAPLSVRPAKARHHCGHARARTFRPTQQ